MSHDHANLFAGYPDHLPEELFSPLLEASHVRIERIVSHGHASMKIPRVKGKRREVRRMLAQRSQELLGRYRSGEVIGEECPLKKALAGNKRL